MSFGKSKDKSSSSQSTQSDPLSPAELAAYFRELDRLTGAKTKTVTIPAQYQEVDAPGTTMRLNWATGRMEPVPGAGGKQRVLVSPARSETVTTGPGRLTKFAQQGTAPVAYSGVTPDQIRALGGLGASREEQVNRARRDALEEIFADPTLTTYQRQRSQQLTDAEAADRLDAILKESEAAITNVAQEEAKRRYDAAVRNSNLTREDLAILAEIFFGGKGERTRSTQSSSSKSSGFNIGL